MKWNTLIKTNIEWIQVPFLQNVHHKSWSKISVEDVGPADNSLNPQIVGNMAATFSRSSCKMVEKTSRFRLPSVEGWNSSLLKEMIASPWWKTKGINWKLWAWYICYDEAKWRLRWEIVLVELSHIARSGCSHNSSQTEITVWGQRLRFCCDLLSVNLPKGGKKICLVSWWM